MPAYHPFRYRSTTRFNQRGGTVALDAEKALRSGGQEVNPNVVNREVRPASSHLTVRGVGFMLLGVAAVLAATAFFYPVRSPHERIMLARGIAGDWVLLTWLTWRVIAVRVTLIAAGVLFLAAIGLPGRSWDTERLRDTYLVCLQRYVGTPYAWGGETLRGLLRTVPMRAR